MAWSLQMRGIDALSGCYATAVFCHACAQCIVGSIRAMLNQCRSGRSRGGWKWSQHQQRGKGAAGRANGIMRLSLNSQFEILLRRQKNRLVNSFFVGQVVVFFKQNAAVRQSACPLFVGTLSIVIAALARAAGFHRRCACTRKQNPFSVLTNYLRHLCLSQK